MARVKRGVNAKKRHNNILKQAKGYFGAKSKLYRTANQAVMKSLNYSYIGRKQRKRDFRKLSPKVAYVLTAARINGMSYSKFISGLKKANININRKMLSEMAINDPAGFAKLVEIAKEN